MTRYAAVIDCDGTSDGLDVFVISEDDGTYVGELANVERVDYAIETGKDATAQITVRIAPGRFLLAADHVAIRRRKLHDSRLRRWWDRARPRALSW